MTTRTKADIVAKLRTKNTAVPIVPIPILAPVSPDSKAGIAAAGTPIIPIDETTIIATVTAVVIPTTNLLIPCENKPHENKSPTKKTPANKNVSANVSVVITNVNFEELCDKLIMLKRKMAAIDSPEHILQLKNDKKYIFEEINKNYVSEFKDLNKLSTFEEIIISLEKNKNKNFKNIIRKLIITVNSLLYIYNKIYSNVILE
jgi:hypothetical protein